MPTINRGKCNCCAPCTVHVTFYYSISPYTFQFEGDYSGAIHAFTKIDGKDDGTLLLMSDHTPYGPEQSATYTYPVSGTTYVVYTPSSVRIVYPDGSERCFTLDRTKDVFTNGYVTEVWGYCTECD